jgi:hypothetical protein
MPNERPMPPARTTCRTCGQTIRAGTTDCVSCATRHADSDAAVFDRWLGIGLGGAGVAVAVVSAYLAARYLNILS